MSGEHNACVKLFCVSWMLMHLLASRGAVSFEVTEVYDHDKQLDNAAYFTFDPTSGSDKGPGPYEQRDSTPSPKYIVYWKTTGQKPDDDITIEVHVETKGWVGFGFSVKGSMIGADILIGGVWPNGTGYLWDRHGTENGFPPMDAEQNYRLLYAAENETHTVLKFQRKLYTCDKHDVPITNATLKLIWAWHSADAVDETSMQKHDFRGARAVHIFYFNLQDKFVDKDTYTKRITVDQVSVPSDYHTLYYCKIFELPRTGKIHLLKYEPYIQPGNELYGHHMVLFQCPRNMSEYVSQEGSCLSDAHHKANFAISDICRYKLVANWAFGEEAVATPDDVGIPMYETSDSPYYMIEMHYDNSKYHKGIVDSSGFSLHLTNTLQKYDAGSMVIGITVTEFEYEQIIPPGQGKITYEFMCPADCTKRLPKEGINVFSAFLHEHLLGTSIRVRHIRGDRELPPLAVDEHYDFNYQQRRDFQQFVKVLPGDTLLLECDYSSMDKTNVTLSGQSTQEEMCLAFLYYYPRTRALENCLGGTSLATHALAMGTTLIERKGECDVEPYVEDPATGGVKLMRDFAHEKVWVEPDEDVKHSKHHRSRAGEIFQQTIAKAEQEIQCAGVKTRKELRTEARKGVIEEDKGLLLYQMASSDTECAKKQKKINGKPLPEFVQKLKTELVKATVTKPTYPWKAVNPCKARKNRKTLSNS